MAYRRLKSTPRTRFLIFEYKERYPQLSAEFISDILNINPKLVKDFFEEGEIIIPSKMNRNGRRKKVCKG